MKKTLFLFVTILTFALNAMEPQPVPALAQQAAPEPELTPSDYLKQCYDTDSATDDYSATSDENIEQSSYHAKKTPTTQCHHCAVVFKSLAGLKRHQQYERKVGPLAYRPTVYQLAAYRPAQPSHSEEPRGLRPCAARKKLYPYSCFITNQQTFICVCKICGYSSESRCDMRSHFIFQHPEIFDSVHQ